MFNPLEKLSVQQVEQLKKYQELLWNVNQEINVISRQTQKEDYWVRHIYHSLLLTLKSFPEGTSVVDFGTGGGLPGIPLAIVFPNVRFTLIDSTAKKIRAVTEMAEKLDLKNIEALPIRAETYKGKAHFAVSRATAPLSDLWKWFSKCQIPLPHESDAFWQAGLICLKGGDLTQEKRYLLNKYKSLQIQEFALIDHSDDYFFAEKAILSVSSSKQS